MEELQLSFLELPSLVLTKIIKLLDSDSIICLAQTCRLFHYLVKEDYLLGITIPHSEPSISKSLLRKKVMKLMINIEGNCTLVDVDWDNIYVDVLEMTTIVQQLNQLDLEETTEVCVNINFSGGLVHQQPKKNYDNIVELTKTMKNLKKYKISINTSADDPILAYVHYIHIHDLLKFSSAKEVVLNLPDIDLEHFWTPLKISEETEKIVIIGPCNGLMGLNTDLFCDNLREITVKPSHQKCKIGPPSESLFHKNGICVVDITSVLKHNWNVQYYNNVYVGDLSHMRQCCSFNLMVERFHENYKKCGGGMEKQAWMECLNMRRRY